MYKAQAVVETPKASRYLRALCNHFDRKVTAEYNDNEGNVQFGFGDCQMSASDTALTLHVQADNDENFGRVKAVVDSHLVRFVNDETVEVVWVDES